MSSSHTLGKSLQSVVLACGDVSVDAGQGWIRHTRSFFPEKTQLVMLMRSCGLTRLKELMQTCCKYLHTVLCTIQY